MSSEANQQVETLISHLESRANRQQKRVGAFKSLQSDLTYLIKEEELDLDETLDVIVEAEGSLPSPISSRGINLGEEAKC